MSEYTTLVMRHNAHSSKVRVCVLDRKNHGQASAKNAGLRAAEGELVLFLDDDLFCDHMLVAEHVAAHTEDNLLVFGPKKISSCSREDNLAVHVLRRNYENFDSVMERQGVRSFEDAMAVTNCSVSRETVLQVGGFDEEFFRALEDLELGQRLWKNGVRFRFRPSAVTFQLYVKSTDELVLDDARRFGGMKVLLCRKHPEFRGTASFMVFFKGGCVRRVAREFVVRLPYSVDPLLRLAERLTARHRSATIRIINARWQLSYYRSLVKAAGGWRRFRRDYLMALP